MSTMRTDALARAVFFLNMNDQMRKASHAKTQVRRLAAMGAASTGKTKAGIEIARRRMTPFPYVACEYGESRLHVSIEGAHPWNRMNAPRW